jgi:hypothetical protein
MIMMQRRGAKAGLERPTCARARSADYRIDITTWLQDKLARSQAGVCRSRPAVKKVDVECNRVFESCPLVVVPRSRRQHSMEQCFVDFETERESYDG